jgi:hypothetical protein
MIAVFVTPNSRAICEVAGATIEEDIGLIKVKDDTTSVAAHFCRYGQLYGGFSENTPKE